MWGNGGANQSSHREGFDLDSTWKTIAVVNVVMRESVHSK